MKTETTEIKSFPKPIKGDLPKLADGRWRYFNGTDNVVRFAAHHGDAPVKYTVERGEYVDVPEEVARVIHQHRLDGDGKWIPVGVGGLAPQLQRVEVTA